MLVRNSVLGIFLGFTWVLSGSAASTHLVDEAPVLISQPENGVFLVDFGRVAFGNIRLMPPDGATGKVNVHFGEAFADGRINRKPPGTVRYNRTSVTLRGKESIVAAPAPDKRNTEVEHPRHPPAILTPPDWGVVLPFRWVEIEGWDGELRPEHLVRQSAYASTWDEEAASFESSDDMLNRIWELSRYSIKATTFAGVYVDGDRERIPYEADAYLNQLSHYYTDTDKQMARDTFDHLMKHPTWPTEWAPHMVFMVYTDWMHTGDTNWLKPRFEALETKLLLERVGDDGLVSSNKQQIKRDDIVDWPKGERDGYVFTERNTVVNAFHLRALDMMRAMAEGLGREKDQQAYVQQLEQKRETFHWAFFDQESGLYRDGVDTGHHALHANLFPLAFGLVPKQHRKGIAEWLVERGMRCSVYAAQYLMESLFENGEGESAIRLMTADNNRSWRHMVESGTTITWEAWDQEYKPNQDWNHAWGAAPANLLPRYILGAEPLTPGWRTALIRPNLSGLSTARGKVPTPRGPIQIEWTQSDVFELSLELPKGVSARVQLPVLGLSDRVLNNGEVARVTREGGFWTVAGDVEGTAIFEVKTQR